MDITADAYLYAGVRMMLMERIDLLYALSTLAQTCAALAAFIGAIGLYQLQALNTRRRSLYQDIAATLGNQPLAFEEVLKQARNGPDQKLADLLGRFDAMGPRITRFRRDLVTCESASLLVVLLSLGGLASMELLERSPLSRVGLWVCSIVAISATAKMLFMISGKEE